MDTSLSSDFPAIPRRMRCSIRNRPATWGLVFRLLRALSFSAALAFVPVPKAAAAACVGDCSGDGKVSVAELIVGVRISLGEIPLSQCAAFDATPDGKLHIDELVLAVNAALKGCPATPTPSPVETEAVVSPTATAEPNATATVTATDTPATEPTATPTLPVVAGMWLEAPLTVVGSTCPTPITDEFAADLASRPPCDITVETLSETTVAVTDCTETRVEGPLERSGTIHITYPTSSNTSDGCTVDLTASAVIPAAFSPTTAAYNFAVSFSGTCTVDDCAIQAQGSWTRH